MPRRPIDPFASFNFKLEIEGITVAGFSEVTGGNSESNVIDYREGDEAITPRKLSGLNKYGNITLKRGMSLDKQLYEWRKTAVDGDITRDIRTMRKDVMSAVATGARNGVAMPATSGTLASLSAAVAGGWGDKDLAEVPRYFREFMLQTYE